MDAEALCLLHRFPLSLGNVLLLPKAAQYPARVGSSLRSPELA